MGSINMFRIRKLPRFLFDNLNRELHCFQPSPYTWAQLRGSDFGFHCFSATPLVFSQKIFNPCKFLCRTDFIEVIQYHRSNIAVRESIASSWVGCGGGQSRAARELLETVSTERCRNEFHPAVLECCKEETIMARKAD